MSLCKNYRLGCRMRDRSVKALNCREGADKCEYYEKLDLTVFEGKTFRPRITQQEAQYLAELLKQTNTVLEQYQIYFKDLETAVNQLDKKHFYAPYSAFKEGYYDKKAELEKWRCRLSYLIHCHKKTHDTLIEKYNSLAEGVSKRGPYKHLNHLFNIGYSASLRETLPEILTKELTPIDELGKRPPLTEMLKQKASQA